MVTQLENVIPAASTGLMAATALSSIHQAGQTGPSHTSDTTGADSVSISSQGQALFQTARNNAAAAASFALVAASGSSSPPSTAQLAVVKNQIRNIQKALAELDRSSLSAKDKEAQRLALSLQLFQLNSAMVKLQATGPGGTSRTAGGSGGSPAPGFASSLS